jgi:heavy metal sensor kinase
VKLKLKTRLTLWYVTLFAIILAGWGFGIVALVRANLYSGLDRSLESRATQISAALSAPKHKKFADIAAAAAVDAQGDSAIAQLLSNTGDVVDHAGSAIASVSLAPEDLVTRALTTSSAKMETVVAGQKRLRLLVVPLKGTAQLVLVGSGTVSADDAVARLVLVMLLTGPLALVAAGAGGWFLARRALAPLAEMTATAAEIGINRLDERVPVPEGGDELAALALTLNKMLARLEEGVDDKRRLVADASHELQTPLAVMRTELDVSLGSPNLGAEAIEVLESAREETDRMTRIVRNLLTLARFDEGTIQLLRKPINLGALAHDAAESLQMLGRERGVDITVEGEDIVVLADPEYIRLVVVNLIENAVKHSGEGTTVHVLLETAGDEVRLSITDTGPGIPEEDQPHVFDRFYRVDRARSKKSGGSGLGLAISREIIEAHDGRVELKSKLGVGSTFRIILPVVPPTKPGGSLAG